MLKFEHSNRAFGLAQADDYDQHEDPGWLRDQLRQRDRVIAELRQEQEEASDLIRRLISARGTADAGSRRSAPRERASAA